MKSTLVITILVLAITISLVTSQNVPPHDCQEDKDCENVGPDYKCVDGFCQNDTGWITELPPEPEIQYRCDDTDPTNSPYFPGTVTEVVGDHVSTYYDSCTDRTTTMEYICGGAVEGKCQEHEKCKEDEGICVESELWILPDVTVKYTNNQYTYEKTFPGYSVYNSIHPEKYDRIEEYTDEKIYSPDDWRIITEYDNRLCTTNVFSSKENAKVTAKFKLNEKLSTGQENKIDREVKCHKIEENKWDCSSWFESPYKKRASTYTCSVEVTDGEDTVTATSEPTVVANYYYPTIRVNSEGLLEVRGGFDYYKKISEIADDLQQALAKPELSAKFVVFGTTVTATREELIETTTITIPEVSYNWRAPRTEESKTLEFFNSDFYTKVLKEIGIPLDAEKDKLIIFSQFIIDVYNGIYPTREKAAAFAPFSHTVIYIGEPYRSGVAHELGHSYKINLCDTYSKQLWTGQNIITSGGCPNRFIDFEKMASELGDEKLYEMIETLSRGGNDPCVSVGGKYNDEVRCVEELKRMITEQFGNDIIVNNVGFDTTGFPFITYVLKTGVMGTYPWGDFYPEVNDAHPLHQYYCPLKDCA